MDYTKNIKYFRPINYKASIIMMVIGFIMLCAIGNNAVVGILGLLLLAGGVGIIVLKKKGLLTDEEYDSAVSSNLTDMKSRALNKLGLDEDEVKEIDPIFFGGYAYKGASASKKGKDDLWRTNKYEAVMLFFSQDEVHCYTYHFSTTENKHTEETDVYFYKDIVSVSTASEHATINGNNIDYESFKLTTAGGTSVSVSLRDVDNCQRSINAMRALLKTKKQG